MPSLLLLCFFYDDYYYYYDYCYVDISFLTFLLIQIWPHSEYPLIPVGKMVLNRNPKNYFAEIEQSAFNPASMVPGIEPSPDKMLQVHVTDDVFFK